jgi:exopolyphosphatase/guanosine-5'-triphosphate,3'-diphosphate pyrophosphatase
LCRARRDTSFPPLEVKKNQGARLRLAFDPAWLEANPLSATALREEIAEWTRIGYEIRVPGLDDIVLAQEPVLAD